MPDRSLLAFTLFTVLVTAALVSGPRADAKSYTLT